MVCQQGSRVPSVPLVRQDSKDRLEHRDLLDALDNVVHWGQLAPLASLDLAELQVVLRQQPVRGGYALRKIKYVWCSLC